MHYAILNNSGNALGWFREEADARAALTEMLRAFPDADVDLVAFEGPTRIDALAADIKGNMAIAADHLQPKSTRNARAMQVGSEQRVRDSLLRLRVDCIKP